MRTQRDASSRVGFAKSRSAWLIRYDGLSRWCAVSTDPDTETGAHVAYPKTDLHTAPNASRLLLVTLWSYDSYRSQQVVEPFLWTETADEILTPLAQNLALAQLDHYCEAWLNAVKGLTEAALTEPVGQAEGPWAQYPMGTLVLHINREVIHHGAEIALLRDLYLHRDHC